MCLKNRLTGVTHGFGSTALAYYRDDRIKTKTHDNGVTTKHEYDAYGNLSTLSHEQSGTVMHKFDYQYDDNQNRTQESEFNGIDTLVTDFEYDDQDRLTQAIYTGDSKAQSNNNQGNGTAVYTYDNNSNRVKETFTTAENVQSKNITYGYDNNDQLTSIVDAVESASTVVDYDTLGNLTQKAQTIDSQTETTNYIYDIRNQLKQVQVGGSTVGQFLYDANGLRVHKTETLIDANTQIANTTQQRYHYQGLNVIGSFAKEENQSSYQANYRYYHDGNQILARINESAFSDTSVENNAVQTYHQDALGSTAVISNRDGSLTARYQYDAFGNVQTETGQAESNDFTYTGHERDQASGLIYAKARYYDPQLGLFLSRDPFEGYDNTPLSLHRYLYAYQNPMKYVDPDGREAILIGNPYAAPLAAGEQIYTSSERVGEIVVSEITGVDHSNARENLTNRMLNVFGDFYQRQLESIGTLFVAEDPVNLGTTLEHDLPDMSPTGYEANPEAGRAKTYQNPIVDVEGYITTTPLSDEFNQSWTTTTDDRNGDYDASPYLSENQGLYVLRDPLTGKIEYVGRGDVKARAYAHNKSEDKSHLVQEILYDGTLEKEEAKHLEQRLMDHFGGAKSVNENTDLQNKIRSYAPQNPNAPKYDVAGKDKSYADDLFNKTLDKLK